MKKILLTAIFFIFTMCKTVNFAAEGNQITANIVDYKIIVNEQEKKFNELIVTINDRTYLPLREIAETLGMLVDWDSTTETVFITDIAEEQEKTKTKTLTLRQGTIDANIVNYNININGINRQLQELIVAINDRTYLPLREIAEILGMVVNWDGTENIITIISENNLNTYKNNLFVFYQNGQYGFMDNTGLIKISPIYRNVQDFSEGLAAVKSDDGNWGYIDEDGEIVIPCNYISAYPFYNGFARVSLREYTEEEYMAIASTHTIGPFHCINTKGELIISEELQLIENFNIHGYARATITTIDGDILDFKEFYIDTKGEHFEDIESKYQYDLKETYTSIELKGVGKCVVDKNFDIVFTHSYEVCYYIGNGYFVAKKNGKYGVVNVKNDVVIDFMYESMSGYNEGLLSAGTKEGNGYINIKNETVIPFIYSTAYNFSYGHAFVRERTSDDKTIISVINKKGEKILTNLPYATEKKFSNGLARVDVLDEEEERILDFYYINLKGEDVIPHY